LGAQAERYFRDDPSTAIVKLRQFAELLAKLIAAHHALYLGERETFEETLRRLSYERILPKEAADIFHILRKLGNEAVHEAKGGHADALASLKFARQIGVWFHRTYARSARRHNGARARGEGQGGPLDKGLKLTGDAMSGHLCVISILALI
jgi:type I restriction enzyme R subunit